jgi:hypothetical protein
MRAALRAFALITVFVLASLPRSALAQPAPPPDEQQPAYAPGELANAGQPFFGTISRGLATVIENAVSTWGRRAPTVTIVSPSLRPSASTSMRLPSRRPVFTGVCTALSPSTT